MDPAYATFQYKNVQKLYVKKLILVHYVTLYFIYIVTLRSANMTFGYSSCHQASSAVRIASKTNS